MYEHRDDIQPGAEQAFHEARTRRRLMIGLGVAVLVALIAFIPGVLLNKHDEDNAQVRSDFVRVTSTIPTTSTTTTLPPVLPGAAAAPAPAPPTTVNKGVVTPVNAKPVSNSPATTKPPPAPCRNSYDPVCGPFRWDPPPAQNLPLVVKADPDKQQATVGQEVKFTLIADDPDAKIDRCVTIDWGDGQTETNGPCAPPPACKTPYGPWTPPPRVADRDQREVRHKYAAARQDPYVATFYYREAPTCPANPYGGPASATGQTFVMPPP